MYTFENPYFNNIDKIILGLVMFSVLWIILKALVDYQEGYGPYGWRWDEMKKRAERKRRRCALAIGREGPHPGIHEYDCDSSRENSYDGYSTETCRL